MLCVFPPFPGEITSPAPPCRPSGRDPLQPWAPTPARRRAGHGSLSREGSPRRWPHDRPEGLLHDPVWFSVRAQLGAPTSPHSLRPEDVSRRTGRSLSAVRAALRQGRIPRDPLPRSGAGRRTRFVWATEEDLRAWTVEPVERVLARSAGLPQDPTGWRSVRDVSQALELSYGAAARWIRRRSPPRLTWGEGLPFRAELRFWLPDLPPRSAPGR